MKDPAFGLNEDTNNVFLSRSYNIVTDVKGTLIGTNCVNVVKMLGRVLKSDSPKEIEYLFKHLKRRAPLELFLTHLVLWVVGRKEAFLYVLTDRHYLLDEKILSISESTYFAVNGN